MSTNKLEVYLPQGWTGTAQELLAMEEIPVDVRIDLVFRKDLVSAKTRILFAVACAREALKFYPNAHPAFADVCGAVESYARGDASWEDVVASNAKMPGPESIDIEVLFCVNAAFDEARLHAKPNKLLEYSILGGGGGVLAAFKYSETAANHAEDEVVQAAAEQAARSASAAIYTSAFTGKPTEFDSLRAAENVIADVKTARAEAAKEVGAHQLNMLRELIAQNETHRA